jgi:hypothetical protein
MSAAKEPRTVDDAHALRALAHPLRLDLLEAVSLHGPLTATAAAALVGESPANCSWHLRQLAKYGYLEPAPGATGRDRPWQRVADGLRWGSGDDDPALEAASRALTEVYVDREFRLIRGAMTQPRHPDWTESTMAALSITWLTAGELEALEDQVMEVLAPYRGRMSHPEQRPAGSRPVRFLAVATADDTLTTDDPEGAQDA